MSESKRRALSLTVLLVLLWVLACWIRLRAMPGATAGSDAIGQYLAGLSLGRGAWPAPPNPESGHSLWIMVWPITKIASSLDQLYTLRFLLGASVAPLAAASAWVLAPRGAGAWIASALAGLLLALDPGLVDTLVISFRGYGAPELVGLATLLGALALRGQSWALAPAGIALLAGVGQHPMAGGMLLGAVCAVPFFWARLGRRCMEWSLGVCALIALPRVYLLKQQSDCGQPALDCLGAVALGSSEPEIEAGAMLTRAFHDRYNVELLELWPIFVLGALLAAIPLTRFIDRRLAPSVTLQAPAAEAMGLVVFAAGGVLGIILLGSSIESLRPYHLRIAAVPLAVMASLGLVRLWPLAMAAGLWASVSWASLQILPPSAVTPQTFDQLARQIADLPGPVRVDAAYLDSPVGLDPAAVVLAAVLQGQDPDRFGVGLEATVVMLVNGQPRAPELEPGSSQLAQGEHWRMIQFPDQIHARRWLSLQQTPAAPPGGAWDWLKVLHPSGADLATTTW